MQPNSWQTATNETAILKKARQNILKLFWTVVLCLLSGLSVFGQTEESRTTQTVEVEEILLARSDGQGKAGEIVTEFLTSDAPFFFRVKLTSMKPTNVKMNLVTVKVGGFKPGEVVVTVSYKTNGKQSGVTFNASPDDVWNAGKYRVDILLDGKLAKSLEFDINKSPEAIEKDKQTRPKPKTKIKTTRKLKKT
jgi:hypothetical protein